MTMLTRRHLSRRDLIKGFGLAGLIAGTLIRNRKLGAAGAAPPRRLLLFYLPAGLFREAWTPNGAGPIRDVQFGLNGQNALDVLKDEKYAAILDDINILDGVNMASIEEGDPHHEGIKAALRGRRISPDDLGPYPDWSIDRVIGSKLFDNQPRPDHLKSACLNVQIGDFGYQSSIRECAEGGSAIEVSKLPDLWDELFKGFTGNVPPTVDPQILIGEKRDRRDRRSLLTGQASAELASLKALLGKDEQVSLDRHLEAMNELQLQAENELKAAEGGNTGMGSKTEIPSYPPGDLDATRDLSSMIQHAAGIIAAGMAYDLNRIAVIHTYGHNNNSSFWFPGADGAYHDGAQHGGRNNGVVNDRALNSYRELVRNVLDIVLKFKAIEEGTGTLLDSTTIATFSDMSNGDHVWDDPTFFLMGGGGGITDSGKRYWNTGRVVKFADRAHNDYLTALALAMQVESVTAIGDRSHNKGPLTGLTT